MKTINTWLQPGAQPSPTNQNRFNGFNTMRTRHQIATYRAAQQRRALKFAVVTSGFLAAGFGIGALSTHGLVAVAGLLALGTVIGFCLHALTRPML